jgi:hypothetical protein
MAQLAVLCTQRRRALGLFRHADQAIHEASEKTSLTECLTQFESTDKDLATVFVARSVKTKARTSTRSSCGWSVHDVIHSMFDRAVDLICRQADGAHSLDAPTGCELIFGVGFYLDFHR